MDYRDTSGPGGTGLRAPRGDRGTIDTHALSEYTGRDWTVVLVFYPFDFQRSSSTPTGSSVRVVGRRPGDQPDVETLRAATNRRDGERPVEGSDEPP